MPLDIIEAVRTGKLHYSKARKLGRIHDEGLRQRLLERALKEGLSVDDLDHEIRNAQQVGSSETRVYITLRSLKSRLSSTRLNNLAASDKKRALKLLDELDKPLQ